MPQSTRLESAVPARPGYVAGDGTSLPPGPRTPAPVQTMRMIRDPVGYLRELNEAFGDAVTLHMVGFGTTVFFTSPDAVRKIFSLGPALPIGPVADIIRDIVGEHSPTQVDGPDHRRMRKLLAPLFTGEALDGYLPALADCARREVSRWAPGETIVLREALERITLEQIVQVTFGFESERERDQMSEAVDQVRAGMQLASMGPWVKHDLGRLSPWGRFVRHRRRLDELILEQIDARRREGPRGGDMLSGLLRTEAEVDERPFTREELRDQLKSLMMGGHETVATTVSWTTGLLLHHREHLGPILEEAEAGEGRLTEALIQEAMRLCPPIVAIGRYTPEPIEIDGWLLPAGIRVWIPASLIHHDPQTYEDPLTFKPDRFLEERPARGTWVSFGGGPHHCIGAGFARHQSRILLQELLLSAELRPAEAELERARAENVISVPTRGMRVIFEGPRAE